VLEKIGKIKSRHGGLPTEADLRAAGRTILRIIDTYGIDIDQLINTGSGIRHQNYAYSFTSY
jgi:hypothetical protein